jgi:hypothetical protein
MIMLKHVKTSADGWEHCKEEEVDADDVKYGEREERRGEDMEGGHVFVRYL